MVAGLLGVMELLKPVHYQRLWSHLAPHPHDRKPLKDFLMRAFLVFRHLIEQDVSVFANVIPSEGYEAFFMFYAIKDTPTLQPFKFGFQTLFLLTSQRFCFQI